METTVTILILLTLACIAGAALTMWVNTIIDTINEYRKSKGGLENEKRNERKNV